MLLNGSRLIMKGTKVTKADIAALAELKSKLSDEGEITIPVSLAKDICEYCEHEAIYDKLGNYGDFYYKLKMAIEKKELLNTIKD